MTIDEFVSACWNDHAGDAEGVWARMPEGLALVDSGAGVFQLANVAAHVAGEHLARWDEGVAFLDRVAALPASDPATPEAKGLRRLQAALHLCAGRAGDSERCLALAQPGGAVRPETPRIRMLAVAASAMAHHGRTAEAAAAFDEALRLAQYGPDRTDPAARDLAMTGNNLSCELEDRPSLGAAERTLMLRAAHAGRRYWEVCGDWTNVERAEYRLALAHVKAGLPAEGLRHAQECLRVVEANGSDPGEAFFAREALARCRLAAGDRAGARTERDAAAAALPRVGDPGFRSYCEGELAKLDAALGSAQP